MKIVMPKLQGILDLISDLLDKKVTAKASKVKLTAKPKTGATVSEFVTQEGSLEVLFLTDLDFAARTGAALSMVPGAVAEEDIKAKKISDALLENFNEISNVVTAVFRSDETRLILKKVHTDPADVSEEAAAILKAQSKRLDIDADVPGYGKGKFALLIK